MHRLLGMGYSLLFDDILKTIGDTPMVRFSNLTTSDMADVYGKLESFNPMGSIKDRAALAMIDDAERRGALVGGMTVSEPTAGNTGIGLALVCARRGYRLRIMMPDNMSRERIAIMSALGAEVELTPATEGMAGAMERARTASQAGDCFMPSQFSNPANALAHELTTGPEILRDLPEVDAVVVGIGTGGTITGIGRCMRRHDLSILMVGVEPEGSAVLSGGVAGTHAIEGIGAGFVPEVLDMDVVDRIMIVSDAEAREGARILVRREGILAGISSGAVVQAALRLARELGPGSQVAVIIPDTGERYLSTDLFKCDV